MDAAPKQIMHGYLDRALQHFVELLSPARRSSTVSAHSTSSMLKVCRHGLSCCSVQLASHLVLTLSFALAFDACHFPLIISSTTGLSAFLLLQQEAHLQGCFVRGYKLFSMEHMASIEQSMTHFGY